MRGMSSTLGSHEQIPYLQRMGSHIYIQFVGFI